MKRYILLANWKSWGSSREIRDWCQTFLHHYSSNPNISVVLFPSFLHIPLVKELLDGVEGLEVGAQEVSEYTDELGSGEMTRDLLCEYCSYYLIGHSFQRLHRDRDMSTITKQVTLINEKSLSPVLCAATSDEIPEGYTGISVYEPPTAISDGTGYGKTADTDDVEDSISKFRKKTNNIVLYGGSINENTIDEILSTTAEGFLVGGASKDPLRFYAIFSSIVQKQGQA